jgi:hypothetical protein
VCVSTQTGKEVAQGTDATLTRLLLPVLLLVIVLSLSPYLKANESERVLGECGDRERERERENE